MRYKVGDFTTDSEDAALEEHEASGEPITHADGSPISQSEHAMFTFMAFPTFAPGA